MKLSLKFYCLFCLLFIMQQNNCYAQLSYNELPDTKATEPIKEWRDTLLYSAIRFESKGVEINYTLYQKYDLEGEYEIKINHNIPDVETIEISEKDLFIKMKYPYRGEIRLDFITEKKKAAQLDLFLFPCMEEDYRRITGMPEVHRHYIKNGDSVIVKIQSYHSIRDSSKYGGTLRREGNIITYTPNNEFIGVDEFGYWGKQIFSKCGGHFSTGHVHYVFVVPKDSLNKKPIARNDTIDYDSQKFSNPKSYGLGIYPFRNDYDSDISLKKYGGLGLKIDSISQPLNGYAEIEPPNSIRYKSIDHSKNDKIEYVISDINGLKSRATIIILKSNNKTLYLENEFPQFARNMNKLDIEQQLDPLTDLDIKKFETRLGIELPPSYKRFLKCTGGFWALGGAIKMGEPHTYIKNYKPLNQYSEQSKDIIKQKGGNWPPPDHGLLCFGEFFMGAADRGQIFLDINQKDKNGKFPVYYYSGHIHPSRMRKIADSFEQWLIEFPNYEEFNKE